LRTREQIGLVRFVKGTCTGVTEIGKNLPISGQSASGTKTATLKSALNARLLIDAGASVTLNSLIITGGFANGGGIFNRGTVTLNDTTVTGNNAFLLGGGIYNQNGGTVIMSGGSTVHDNTSGGLGGGIYNECGGTLVGAVDGGNVYNSTRNNISQRVLTRRSDTRRRDKASVCCPASGPDVLTAPVRSRGGLTAAGLTAGAGSSPLSGAASSTARSVDLARRIVEPDGVHLAAAGQDLHTKRPENSRASGVDERLEQPSLALLLSLERGVCTGSLLKGNQHCPGRPSVNVNQGRPRSGPTVLRQGKTIKDLRRGHGADADHHKARAMLPGVLPSEAVPLTFVHEQVRNGVSPQRPDDRYRRSINSRHDRRHAVWLIRGGPVCHDQFPSAALSGQPTMLPTILSCCHRTGHWR
jgi:hypothetical protein